MSTALVAGNWQERVLKLKDKRTSGSWDTLSGQVLVRAATKDAAWALWPEGRKVSALGYGFYAEERDVAAAGAQLWTVDFTARGLASLKARKLTIQTRADNYQASNVQVGGESGPGIPGVAGTTGWWPAVDVMEPAPAIEWVSMQTTQPNMNDIGKTVVLPSGLTNTSITNIWTSLPLAQAKLRWRYGWVLASMTAEQLLDKQIWLVTRSAIYRHRLGMN